MLSLNKSYKNRKVSLTIHCKYKYFDSTVQRAEDRRQKFYFCHLSLTSRLTSLIFDVNVVLANLKFHAVRAASEYICTKCHGLLKKINDLQQILEEELQKSMGINYATTLKKVYLGIFAENGVDGLIFLLPS